VTPDARIRIVADPAWGWCAGLRHPPEADYEPGMFNAAQLEQLEADDALTLIELDVEGAPVSKPAKRANRKMGEA
jgi:hypothetical protein